MRYTVRRDTILSFLYAFSRETPQQTTRPVHTEYDPLATARSKPELRNRIFEMVMRAPNRISIYVADNAARASKAPLALTTVCCQLRVETHDMFFAVNDFTLVTHYLSIIDRDPARLAARRRRCMAQVGRWLDLVGFERSRMAAILCIDLGHYDAPCVMDLEFAACWEDALRDLAAATGDQMVCISHFQFEVRQTVQSRFAGPRRQECYRLCYHIARIASKEDVMASLARFPDEAKGRMTKKHTRRGYAANMRQCHEDEVVPAVLSTVRFQGTPSESKLILLLAWKEGAATLPHQQETKRDDRGAGGWQDKPAMPHDPSHLLWARLYACGGISTSKLRQTNRAKANQVTVRVHADYASLKTQN